MIYRVEYTNEKVVAVNEHDENSVTYTSNKVVVDTPENASKMLTALGIDCSLIDVKTGAYFPPVQ